MPDISKCSGNKCPSKEKCYRYTCKSSKRQSYADFHNYVDKDLKRCENFWDKKLMNL